MVELFWQKEKLDSASFEEFSFWTETIDSYLMDLENSNGADILDLRFWLEEQEDGQGSEFLEQEIIGL